MVDKLDGWKSYLVGGLMILAAISIWVLNFLGIEQDIPSVDMATSLFWLGLAVLTGRDAARKVINEQKKQVAAIDRLANLVNTSESQPENLK